MLSFYKKYKFTTKVKKTTLLLLLFFSFLKPTNDDRGFNITFYYNSDLHKISCTLETFEDVKDHMHECESRDFGVFLEIAKAPGKDDLKVFLFKRVRVDNQEAREVEIVQSFDLISKNGPRVPLWKKPMNIRAFLMVPLGNYVFHHLIGMDFDVSMALIFSFVFVYALYLKLLPIKTLNKGKSIRNSYFDRAGYFLYEDTEEFEVYPGKTALLKSEIFPVEILGLIYSYLQELKVLRNVPTCNPLKQPSGLMPAKNTIEYFSNAKSHFPKDEILKLLVRFFKRTEESDTFFKQSIVPLLTEMSFRDDYYLHDRYSNKVRGISSHVIREAKAKQD